MKRKQIVILSCISFGAFFAIPFAMVGQKEESAVMLANVEALSLDEDGMSLCTKAGGYCAMTIPIVAGIQMAND